jgi:hypothetical protein
MRRTPPQRIARSSSARRLGALSTCRNLGQGQPVSCFESVLSNLSSAFSGVFAAYTFDLARKLQY